MTKDVHPMYSRSRVRKAGERLKTNEMIPEDIDVIENWRESHRHILNSWQATLRVRCKGTNIVVAQRLKKFFTIVNKLSRQPNMTLDTMHDIAGCRLIFKNIDDLILFRNKLHASRFQHQRKKEGIEPYPYDYISTPKADGYRGIHDIYSYKAASNRKKDWDSLLVEIQYRTVNQHAWATAVEIAGNITGNHVKFNKSNDDFKYYFKLASEIISRSSEKMKSCLPDVSNNDLKKDFLNLDKKLNLLDIFTGFNNMIKIPEIKRKNVIISVDHKNMQITNANDKIRLYPYENFTEATIKLFELEKKNPDLDIVLVRSFDTAFIEKTYNNYFMDAKDFVSLIKSGLATL